MFVKIGNRGTFTRLSCSPASFQIYLWNRIFTHINSCSKNVFGIFFFFSSFSVIDHFCVTSHMTNCVFGRHVGGKTKKNKKSFWKKYVNNIEYNR